MTSVYIKQTGDVFYCGIKPASELQVDLCWRDARHLVKDYD